MNISIVQIKSRNKFPFNIGALLIMKFQKTNYSHYAIRVETLGDVMYYDSTAAGTRTRTAAVFNKAYTLQRTFEIGKEISYIDFMSFFSQHKGKGYGFVQLFGLFLKLCKVIQTNPFGGGSKRLICNELVILLLNELGYTDIQDTDSLDLNDTEEILKKVL